jgi:hypothetical protein
MRVTFLPHPRADASVRYQRYYVLGLERCAAVRVANLPLLARVRRRPSRQVDALARISAPRSRAFFRLRRVLPAGRVHDSGLTGRYVADVDGVSVRFAIDARDSHPIHDPEILEWSELYFKANAWPQLEYDPRVEPIVNGNGSLDERDLAHLRSLRDRPKDVDVTFVSRVWGGREHNVRLFEELAKVRGTKRLRAIFTHHYEEVETAGYMERLRRAGIDATFDELPRHELWDLLGRSRVVVLRAGKHLCIPWRAIDLLAMGACILWDSPPFPRWPEPLEPGVQYATLGIERPEDTSTGPDETYERIAPLVEELVADESRAQAFRDEAAAYFDRHAAPERVAAHVLERVAEHAGAANTSPTRG